MERVTIDKIENFKKFVDEMELGCVYDLTNDRYKWIRIEKTEHWVTKEILYCWCAEYNYYVAGCVGYLHPYGGTNKVKHFKTESGAKRNFYNRFKHHFEPC